MIIMVILGTIQIITLKWARTSTNLDYYRYNEFSTLASHCRNIAVSEPENAVIFSMDIASSGFGLISANALMYKDQLVFCIAYIGCSVHTCMYSARKPETRRSLLAYTSKIPLPTPKNLQNAFLPEEFNRCSPVKR